MLRNIILQVRIILKNSNYLTPEGALKLTFIRIQTTEICIRVTVKLQQRTICLALVPMHV